MRSLLGIALASVLFLQPAWGGGKNVVTLDGLKSELPASWKMQEPSNKFRAYQFAVPQAEGDKEGGELVVFFFGPGGGGSPGDNLKRWKGMFEAPDGKSIDEIAKTEKFKVGGADVTYLDVQGTFLFKSPPFDPNAKVQRKTNYRQLGVVFASENGPYFITLKGPAKTVQEHKSAFDGWIKAFK